MPGIDQLKKFSEDIKNIGGELEIRRSREEEGDYFAIPATITNPEGKADDSEDFIDGLPTQTARGEPAADAEMGDDAELPDFDFTLPGTAPRKAATEGLDLGNLTDDGGPLPGALDPTAIEPVADEPAANALGADAPGATAPPDTPEDNVESAPEDDLTLPAQTVVESPEETEPAEETLPEAVPTPLPEAAPNPDLDLESQFVSTDTFQIPDIHIEKGEVFDDAAPLPDVGESNADPEISPQEYQRFMENISLYPLNLRIQILEIIAQEDFDGSMRIRLIGDVAAKVTAKKLSITLEKLTGISVPVPLDYEARSVGNILTYRQSWSFRLRNRIIPAIIALAVIFVVGAGLFLIGQTYVYNPIMADRLYKQGYALLKDPIKPDYPGSVQKFDAALRYQSQKKWFFNYARGYREQKQFKMAEMMYQNILQRYNHDKQAGLEYAEMEAYDSHDYEKAEEIVRREVLDWHLNDSDGLLLLGDIDLEAGTEDPESGKLDKARQTYADLMALYGPLDIYQSRMMRYFIRTDNLQEVIPLKNYFMEMEAKKNPLTGRDLIELGGYLLEKEFGPLAPHEEKLREFIEGVRSILEAAMKQAPNSPEAYHNFGKYFVYSDAPHAAIQMLEESRRLFDLLPSLNRRQAEQLIKTYRLLGDEYFKERENLLAEENLTEGIALFEKQKRLNGMESNSDVGAMFASLGDLYYFIDYSMDDALYNYQQAIVNYHDTPSIRYRVGYINYGRSNFANAFGSFIKAVDGAPGDYHALLALANTLALQNNNYAAEGYYHELIERIDLERDRLGIVLPQVREEHAILVENYLKAANNLGVALYRQSLSAERSSKIAQAILWLSESNRAWDALNRNPVTMNRVEGSNLARENIRYITSPSLDFIPEMYTSLPRTLLKETVQD